MLGYHSADVRHTIGLPGMSAAGAVLRVAMLGAGTVGREVARAFLERPDTLAAFGCPRLELVAIAVRDVGRARAAGLPDALLTDGPAHLVADPGTDVIVEVFGGEEPARTLIAAALESGKAVVTANKHVLAHHGAALEAVARRTGAPLRFEAAVGGGIPILAPLAGGLAGSRITRIRGIVNGSTNYILTAMTRDGRSMAECLADAQAAGYAEADPAGDVEGDDAVNKLVVLARLGFGRWIEPGEVVCRPATVAGLGRPGIAGVTAAEIAGAAALGLSMKLVADVRAGGPDERLEASVLPTAVPLADPLGRIDGVTNRVEVRAEPLGSIAFTGPGAGGPPSATAILADLLAIARGEGSTWAGLPPAGQARDGELTGPADRAPDRGWFAVLAHGDGPPDDAAETATTGDSHAVHWRERSLADVRETLARRGVPGTTTIYPADERTGAAR
jgi:homoserine dehydrogenase